MSSHLRPPPPLDELAPALALAADGRLRAASEVLAAIIRHQPDHPEALASLAEVLHRMREDAACATILTRALQAAPARAIAALKTSVLLLRAGIWLGQAQQLDAALIAFDAAVEADPASARAWLNRGVALCKLARFDDALHSTRTASRLDPSCAEAEFGSAVALIALGAWREGWRCYEARWRLPGSKPRTFAAPSWRGEGFAGRTLLVHGEQGFGDMLQFVRFVPAAAARGGRVVLEVPAALGSLFASVSGVAVVATAGEPPPHDLHCPLLSLPRVLGATFPDLPKPPYLRAEPWRVAQWRAAVPPGDGLRVGLVWAGGGRRVSGAIGQPDDGRSLPAEALAPLGRIAGVRLVSLQLGAGHGVPPLDLLDPVTGVRDFADTAALMAALDLVISVDTAAAHLAGALGHPVWLLRRFEADWRWPDPHATDTPWYPTMRLFRQHRPGDWSRAVDQVAAALAALAQPLQMQP